MDRRCLYCYEPLADSETDYHARCSRKMFGTDRPPLMPYTNEKIGDLAERVIRSQTTLTGVQPKLSLDMEDNGMPSGRFTIVGLWGRFILKPQTERYPLLPENEDLTMHLAKLARIETVPHSLVRFADGSLCYLTRRIDRTGNGTKIPMEDMCQLSERLTEDKYKGSYEHIAKIVRHYSSVPKLDLVRYWEQVIFSWIVGNADMHLKNFSLYAPERNHYMLTPAYDWLSTALAMPDDNEELALTLCGKKRKITASHFMEAMLQSGLEKKVCDNTFRRFTNKEEAWKAFILKSFLPPERQGAYVSLIEERLAALRRTASDPS